MCDSRALCPSKESCATRVWTRSQKEGHFPLWAKGKLQQACLEHGSNFKPQSCSLTRPRDTGVIRASDCGPMRTALNQILLPRCSCTGELFWRKYAARKKLFSKIVFNEAIYFYTFQGSLAFKTLSGNLIGWYLSFILLVLSLVLLVLITNGDQETFPQCMKLPSPILNTMEIKL